MAHKILIVDDEADVRTFLTAVLKKEGYETLTAVNGREALEIVRRESATSLLAYLDANPEKASINIDVEQRLHDFLVESKEAISHAGSQDRATPD